MKRQPAPGGKAFLSAYAFEPHRIKLLTLAAEAWDQTVEARKLIARDGLCVPGREGGLRPHPAVAIERDSRLAFERIMRALGPGDAGEPKRRPGRPVSPPYRLGPDS